MLAFFFRTEYRRYLISNRYSAQELGEEKKPTQRDSNSGPTVDATFKMRDRWTMFYAQQDSRQVVVPRLVLWFL